MVPRNGCRHGRNARRDRGWAGQADQRRVKRARALYDRRIRAGPSRTRKTGGGPRRRPFAEPLAAAPEPHQPIAAIGLTGQMHGAVMLDENGAVLRPSLIWCDTRTQPQCDWLHEKIGYEKLIELTCNPALPNFTLTKLLWVKDARA